MPLHYEYESQYPKGLTLDELRDFVRSTDSEQGSRRIRIVSVFEWSTKGSAVKRIRLAEDDA